MSLAISALAFIVFTALLWIDRIGEASYCFLVAVSVLLGIVLHGFGRLQELDLKNLRIVLHELQQAKHDLYVREERLKAIALPLAQIIALTGASEGRLGSKESWDIKRAWYKSKITSLISALNLTTSESAEALKYSGKYEEIDRALGERGALQTGDPDYAQTKAKLNALADELHEMMRTDIGAEANVLAHSPP